LSGQALHAHSKLACGRTINDYFRLPTWTLRNQDRVRSRPIGKRLGT